MCKVLFASTLGLPERSITRWTNDLTKILTNKHQPVNQIWTKKCQAYKSMLLSLIFLRTGWNCCLLLIHTTAETQWPTETRSSYTPGTIIAQLQLLEWGHWVSVPLQKCVPWRKICCVCIPRKDQCDVCVSFKHMNISRAKYDAHVKKNDEARQEKSHDKESANKEKSVWTMALQAVLLCPKTQARCLYYKTKLEVHKLYPLQFAYKGKVLLHLGWVRGGCQQWCFHTPSVPPENMGFLQHQSTLVKHDEIMKHNGSYFSSIKPGKKAGDPTVHDLPALQI